ncbi:MAG: hypothetical protein IID45_04645 [Planctomycetes bacterium]|nr:hypothetical protein [Planctomycetota bacterium]
MAGIVANAKPRNSTLAGRSRWSIPATRRDKPTVQFARADAYTVDHANLLDDGTTIITGNAYGSSVNYDGTGAKDILKEYVTAMFQKAGYTNIMMTDVRNYHDDFGSLHCGTNVRRILPALNWWEK